MTATYLTRFFDRGFDWITTSGLRVLLIGLGMVILLTLLKRVTTRLRVIYEGQLPGPYPDPESRHPHVYNQGWRPNCSRHRREHDDLVRSRGGLEAALSGSQPGRVSHRIRSAELGQGHDLRILYPSRRFDSYRECGGGAGVGGLVEEGNLRTIILRDLAGNVHVVPNGSIEKVKNMTMDYSYYLFDINVAYREDVDEVMTVLKQIAGELQTDTEYAKAILEPLEMLSVNQFADSAVVIKCRIKTQPLQQWRVGREMNRRIKKTFDARGIKIPFPHRTIYWGEPKQGTAPPLEVAQASKAS